MLVTAATIRFVFAHARTGIVMDFLKINGYISMRLEFYFDLNLHIVVLLPVKVMA